jgi:galactose-1-phosphate uridylyltransferase
MKTHCRNGHLYDESTTVYQRNKRGQMDRICRTCRAENKRRRRTAKDKPVVRVVNPYRSDYEFGLRIAQKRRAERQAQVRAAMARIKATWTDLAA